MIWTCGKSPGKWKDPQKYCVCGSYKSIRYGTIEVEKVENGEMSIINFSIFR